MPAPPKPWEKAGATGQSSVALPAASTAATSAASSSSPALPPKPANMTTSATAVTPLNSVGAATVNNTYANRYGATSAYGAGSAYGGYGSTYGSSYGASPCSRFGGGYGSYGGAGYGAGYGSFGSPYGGVGAFGAPGMQPDMSLTRTMESGTAATFQLLQSIVSAFGGFAQMLESTFMATHSSFFAMIGVAEQLASLRNWLGEALSVFTMIRFVKRMLGRGDDTAQIGAAAGGNRLSADGFRAFEQSGTTTPVSGNSAPSNQPRPSKKPLVIFFLTVIGLPWLMTKLVKLMTARQEAEARRLGLPPGAIIPLFDPNGQPLPQHLQPPGVDLNLLPQNQQAMLESAVDPSKLTFVRALHSHASNDEFELSFEKNDIVAVLTPKEERADPGWWRGRLRDGRVGWFPSTHVQEIPMNAKKVEDEKLK